MSTVGSVAKSAALGLVAFGALRIGKDLFTDSIAEAREAQKTMANTAAVIKATGGVAGVTAKDVDKLSSRLSSVTGIDDEVVAQGANLLLTFKNVKKEGGIFDRATASALDLSAAGFGSVESASKTLGKALNDPVKGVSALAKQGVTFTQVQKDQIANFVKTGNAAKAQNLILKEVESQVGGQAAAQATAGEKLAVTVGNIKEQIGTALLPVLDRMATYLAEKLPGWITTAGNAFQTVKGYIMPVVDTIRSFFGSVDSGSGTASAKFAQFQSTATTVFTAVQSVISSTVTIVTALWQRFGGTLTTYATNALTNVLNFVRGAFTVLQGLFNVVAGLLTGDWKRVWTGLKGIASGALTAVKAVVSQGLNVITTVFRLLGTTIKSLVSGAFNALKGAASAGVNALIGFVKGIPGKVKSALGDLKSLLLSAGGDIVAGLAQGIRDRAQAAWDAAKSLADGVKDRVKGALSIFSPSRVMRAFGQFVSQGLALGMIDRSGDVNSAVDNLAKIINEKLPKKITKPKAVAKWYKEHDKAVLAGEREVSRTLKNAALERLNAAKQQWLDYSKAVSDAAKQYAGLASMTLGENENRTGAGIAQFLQDRLSAINNFNAKLYALKQRGVANGIYDQIVQMGVDQGTGYADALLTSTPEVLAQVNSLQNQINYASQALGNSTAATMYGSGVQAAQGFYDGLNAMLKKIQQQGVKLANSLVKALKKALGIKSPSRVMRAMGGFTTQGLLDGLDADAVAKQGKTLATSLVKGYARPDLDAQLVAGYSASNTKSGNTYQVTVVVDDSMSPEQYGVKISKAIKSAEKAGLIRN